MVPSSGVAWATSPRPSPSLTGDGRGEVAHATPDDGTMLVAQNGDYEVYFDGKGNRVIVDSYTGKVVAIQPPQTRFDRRALRAEQRRRDMRRDSGDDYYLDNPADVERFRRKRLEEGGSGYSPPADGYDPYGDNSAGTVPPDDGAYGGNYPEEVQPQPDIQRRNLEPTPLDQASIDPAQ